MMIPQNKNVCQLVWHLQYVHTAVEGSELYCYNTEGDRNTVISQASCRIYYVTGLAQCAYFEREMLEYCSCMFYFVHQ